MLPVRRMFDTALLQYSRSATVRDCSLREVDHSIFDRAAVESLIEGQKRGRRNADRLFALTMFELWRREYRVAV